MFDNLDFTALWEALVNLIKKVFKLISGWDDTTPDEDDTVGDEV